MRKTFKQKLTSSLLTFLLLFQLIAGVFLPFDFSFSPPEITVKQANAAGEAWYDSILLI